MKINTYCTPNNLGSGQGTQQSWQTTKQLLDEGNVVVAVLPFVKKKKAFDTVNHVILLNKLKTFNFSDQAIAWFHT